jgi:DNA-binding transcriptional ArsR family regulator
VIEVPFGYLMDSDEILRAIAHPMRRQILTWLKPSTDAGFKPGYMHKGLTVSDLQRLSGLAQSTVSGHLRTLLDAKLVSPVKVGQTRRYCRRETTLAKLKQLTLQAL